MTDAAAGSLEPGDQLVAPTTAPRRRRTALATAGVVGVAAVVAGGVWVGQSFLARGPQPAEALPASTLGYAALDLDPSGSQKVEAATFVDAFPSLGKGKSSGDLRERFFNLVMSDATCDLKFADIEPWIGNRVAFAVVGYDKPEPVFVLEVNETAGLEKGLDKIEKCAGDPAGHAVRGHWAAFARTDAVAKSVLADGAAAPLSEDADFQKWTGKAGDPGIATVYAAPAAGDAILKAAEDEPMGAVIAAQAVGSLDPIGVAGGMWPIFALGLFAEPIMSGAMDEGDEMAGSGDFKPLTPAEERRLEDMTPQEQQKFFEKRFPMPDKVGGGSGGPGMRVQRSAVRLAEDPGPGIPDEIRSALHGFRGAGGVLRFADGALEFQLVADHVDVGAGDLIDGNGGDDLLKTLPAGTPAAYGADLATGWGAKLVDVMTSALGEDDVDLSKEFEKETGLAFPEDLETLGGDSFALTLGKGFTAGEFFEETPPIAARVHGDAARIEAVLTKLVGDKPQTGGPTVVWRRDGGDVLIGMDKTLLDTLAGSSGLTDSKSYEAVLPEADDAASVLFIDFDADDWLVKSMSKQDKADARPFKALGFSRTVKDGEDHTLIRLTTD
jgi:hypothetical protein